MCTSSVLDCINCMGVVSNSVSRCMAGASDVEVTSVCVSPDTGCLLGSMDHSLVLRLTVQRRKNTRMALTVCLLNVCILIVSRGFMMEG